MAADRTGVQLHNSATPNCVDNEINSHQYLVVAAPHLPHWAAVANLGPLQGRKSLTEELHGNEEKGRQEKEALTYAIHYLARTLKLQKKPLERSTSPEVFS